MSSTALNNGVCITDNRLLPEIEIDVRKVAVTDTKNLTYGFETHL